MITSRRSMLLRSVAAALCLSCLGIAVQQRAVAAQWHGLADQRAQVMKHDDGDLTKLRSQRNTLQLQLTALAADKARAGDHAAEFSVLSERGERVGKALATCMSAALSSTPDTLQCALAAEQAQSILAELTQILTAP